jgi:phage-related protein
VFDIEFYTLPDGRKPVEEFLDSLPAKMRIKAIDSLDLLEEYGNQLRLPYSKALSDGLFELRIKFSSDITRIFYFFYIGNKIVVTNGFVKKTQKTPQTELAKAQKYKQDYERRHTHE